MNKHVLAKEDIVHKYKADIRFAYPTPSAKPLIYSDGNLTEREWRYERSIFLGAFVDLLTVVWIIGFSFYAPNLFLAAPLPYLRAYLSLNFFSSIWDFLDSLS